MARSYARQTRPSSWRRLAIASWRKPNDPTVYGAIEVDASAALALIERVRRQEQIHLTLTHLVARALARSLARNPDGNGLIIGRRVYQRDEVDIFCQVASDDGRDLSGVKIRSADRRPLLEIARELEERAARVRARQDTEVEQTKNTLDRIPMRLLGPIMELVRWLSYDVGLDLRRLGVAYDQFGSAMVTSVGALEAGLGPVFAPLVPFSHVPIVVLVNAVQRKPIAIEDRVEIRPVMNLGCTFDHRFIDGVVASRIARGLRDGLLDAEGLL